MMMKEFMETPLIDAVVIAGSRKVEHFEMSAYMNLKRSAEMLEKKADILKLLEESLAEEMQTDQILEKFATTDPSAAGERDMDR